ncbi:MAG: RsmE family RNA methyltransferase [Desulfosarcinaceae bacterium]|nr:RsmE family RNA methyltransferase [Desulfosarcinaceae bacterium]
MRRFFILANNLANNVPEIVGPDARHIAQVLRMQPGELIELFDGSGWVYEARLEDVHPQRVRVSVTRRYQSPSESPLKLTVACGYLKEKKMDLLARSLTELGVHHWWPFFGMRSVPSPEPKRLAARVARWQKISLEAVKQCERGRPMTIEIHQNLAAVLAAEASSEVKLLFWERGDSDQRFSQGQRSAAASALLLLGPEGGFAPREIAAAHSAGFDSVSLGPRILRAETAVQCACALVQHRYGDMGKSP